MITAGWTKARFADVADYKAGRTPARAVPEYWTSVSDGVPWVAISDMSGFGRVNATREHISRTAYEQVFRGQSVPAGTLLMSFKLTIGRTATLGVDACHNEAIIAIYPKSTVEQRFLGYYLSQVDFEALQDRQIKGNTLNQEKIDRIEILYPSLQEQNVIADVLDRIRRAIDIHERILATADELKRGAMQDLFSRGLRHEPQKDTEIGEMPASWIVSPLGSLGRVGNGSTPRKTVREYWEGGTYPWLTSSKMYDREIEASAKFVTATALRECHLPQVEPGAVLIAITGQGKTLGHCAVLRIQATVNQHIAYVATDQTRVDPSYLRGYLETQYNYLRQVGSGGGSTKGALTCAFLRSMSIPLPSLEEQREVAAILDALDHKIDLHRRKRAVLDELFKSLLRKLMTGEISVADLDLSALEPKGDAEAAA